MANADQADRETISRLTQSLESLTRVLEGSQLGFWDWNIATNEVKRNAIWAEMLGYRFDDIAFTTQQWTDFVHPDDKEAAWASINAVLEGRASEHQMTYRMKTKSGNYKWILDRARVVERDSDGKPLRMSGTHTNVDQLKKIEDALYASEKRFRGIFENAGIGIAEVDLDGRFRAVNDAYCRIVGYDRDVLLNEKKTFQAITFGADLEADLNSVRQLIFGAISDYQIEKRYVGSDGKIVWIHLSVTLLKDADSSPAGFISSIQDITELKKLQEELEYQARFDYLTGIPNRRYFMELAAQELARTQRYLQALALIIVDIDFFKRINDRYGHQVGDIVLQKITQIMRNELREVDIMGRLGGEEFAILLPQANQAKALDVSHRLKNRVADTAIVLDTKTALNVTVSGGITIWTDQDDTIVPLLHRADKALYQAKETGRNRFILYGAL